MFEHLAWVVPSFTGYGRHRGFLARFKHRVFAIDSSTIQLALNCFDWAKHRRRKAAAKLHMNLDVGSRLPSLAVVESAAAHDSKRAEALCKGLSAGDIAVADRAYTDFGFMRGLDTRGIFFVLRNKQRTRFQVLGSTGKGELPAGVLADEIVEPMLVKSRGLCGEMRLRRVRALVEVDGRMRELTFLTNNLEWAPRTVAELYRARWEAEIFFKEIKQTCQIRDFVGYNEYAVRWQVWIGLLAHLLLRFMAHLSKWGLSFSRLAGIVRHTLWLRRDLMQNLFYYGTAGPPGGDGTVRGVVGKQGFFDFYVETHGTAD